MLVMEEKGISIMVEIAKEAKVKKGFTKRLVGLVLAVVVVIVALLMPGNDALSHEGIMSLGILFACVVLWICDTLPVAATGLLGAILLAVFGVVNDFATAWSGFTSSTVWFIFGVFVMTAIMIKTSLGRRLVGALVSKAGTKPKSIVLAYMLATAIVSMFMTDTGAVAVGMALALPFLKEINAKEKKPNLGRCLAFGIACAALIGGFITPFGHSLNILCAGLLTSTYGLTIGFFQWFIPGLIVAIIMIPAIWFCICKVFPPEELSEQEAALVASTGHEGPMDTLDKKSLVYMIVLVIGFVLGNWIPVLSNINVVIVMLAVAFVPGVDILSWKDFEEAEGWGVVLMVGGVMCMANAATSTGAAAYVVNLFLNSGIMGINTLLALIIIMAVAYLVHTFVPAAPALCALFVPPVMGFCVASGISPAIFAMLMASVTAGSFLMPMSPPMMVSYNEGYYTIAEQVKAGWLISVIAVLVEVLVVYFVGGLILPRV